MTDDPILREIRAFRDELAKRFQDDPEGYRAWMKAHEDASRRAGRQLVSRLPKRIKRETTAST